MDINNLRIGQRLAIGFGIVIFLLVLLAGLSTTRLASLNHEMDAPIHLRYANTVSANAIKADVNEATRGLLGEQGRGFAVVAAKVRSLSQRSAAAAKEIQVLIGDSSEKVRAGSLLVQQAGATMREVADSVRRVPDIMAEITAASMEQSAGIAQLSRNVVEMDSGTRENAALLEDATAAALQEQAA